MQTKVIQDATGHDPTADRDYVMGIAGALVWEV